jgi:hypothetical protein
MSMSPLDTTPHKSLTVTLRVPAGVAIAQVDIQEGVVALLFHDGKVSNKEACDLLGKSRREFDDILAAHGFIQSERIDPNEEIKASKDW